MMFTCKNMSHLKTCDAKSYVGTYFYQKGARSRDSYLSIGAGAKVTGFILCWGGNHIPHS